MLQWNLPNMRFWIFLFHANNLLQLYRARLFKSLLMLTRDWKEFSRLILRSKYKAESIYRNCHSLAIRLN